jgi:hypothetical protein
MKHTKDQVIAIAEKLLAEINRPYFNDKEIFAGFEHDLSTTYGGKVLKNGWWVCVQAHDDQFDNDGGVISMCMDDDTGEIEGYKDCTCGRPVPMRAKKDDSGKYFLEYAG